MTRDGKLWIRAALNNNNQTAHRPIPFVPQSAAVSRGYRWVPQIPDPEPWFLTNFRTAYHGFTAVLRSTPHRGTSCHSLLSNEKYMYDQWQILVNKMIDYKTVKPIPFLHKPTCNKWHQPGLETIFNLIMSCHLSYLTPPQLLHNGVQCCHSTEAWKN